MVRDLIYDLGLHTAEDTEFFLKKGFRVIAIEANPALAEAARLRFARAIAEGDLVVLNVGVAAAHGELPFYLNVEQSAWSSFDETLGKGRGPYRVVRVETAPLSELLHAHGVPYYLKIDIEGYDELALRDLTQLPDRPAYVSVESATVGMLQQLVELGYTGFKFVNQARVPEMRCPQPAREGRLVEHSFLRGASGPFGEEIAGAWTDRAGAERQIVEYWATPGLDAALHGWFDLHARRPVRPDWPWSRLIRARRMARRSRGAGGVSPGAPPPPVAWA
jgi:FkbM family methyltransferase